MTRLHTPNQFKSSQARVIMGVIGLFLAYLLISRAFDTGSIWQYSGTILLIFVSVRLIFRGKTTKQQ